MTTPPAGTAGPTASASAERPNGPPPPHAEPLVARCYRRWFREPWEAIDREAETERAVFRNRGGRFDARPLQVLLLCSMVLMGEEYFGDRPTFDHYFPSLADGRYGALLGLSYWCATKWLGYLLVPAIYLRLIGVRLRDCGLSTRGLREHAWIYLVLFAAILPVLVAVSYTRPFQMTYPFYKLAGRSWFDYLTWELEYGLSFFALEFFFRGFLLFVLRRSFGAAAIFVMSVPYCMIHFHKPVLETTGAAFAGILLGTLALRTRSIWCGFLIHVSVAWSMDLLALLHTSGLPDGNGRWVG